MSLYVIVGPPAAGKTTWLRDHAKHGDITIDFNALAATLTPADVDAQFPAHSFPEHVRGVAQAAWMAVVDTAIAYVDTVNVYMIHAMPSRAMLDRYHRLNATIITIDPGRDVVTQRCRQQRPSEGLAAANKWYDDEPSRGASYAAATSINDVYQSAMGRVDGLPRWY